MSDPETTVRRLAEKAGRLYTLPAAAMKVLELTANPQVDTHALKECLENDPALTAKLLSVVNSSLFGLSREVSDLGQALALLGIKPLKLLVLGFSLPAELSADVGGDVLGRYWRHALTKAVAARQISESLRRAAGDEAFIAGLLEDIGILLLIQELGTQYLKFLDKVFNSGGDLRQLETEAIGFDHTMLTAGLIERWGLPGVLVEAISSRSRSPKQPPADGSAAHLSQVLHLAELFARFLADGHALALDELLAVDELDTGLSHSRIGSMLEDVKTKVDQLADSLSLKLSTELNYDDLLMSAHERLAAVAAEVAEDLIGCRTPRAESEPSREELLDEFQSLSQAVVRAARQIHRPSGLKGPEPTHKDPAPDAKRTPKPAKANQATAVCPEPGLLGRLAKATTICRQNRCSLSLLLVELIAPGEVIANRGVEVYNSLTRSLKDVVRAVDHDGAVRCEHSEAGWAVLLPNCDRQPAVELAHQLIDAFGKLAARVAPSGTTATALASGVATVSMPSKNFNPEDLFARADRCLYASTVSGGSVVKSIEIY